MTHCPNPAEPHPELSSLYRSLLEDERHYAEFQELLSRYPATLTGYEPEPPEAAELRLRINRRIRSWVGESFADLSVEQVTLWRTIIVEGRFDVGLPPSRGANGN